jgi:peptidoglycan/xylan/chitin deacetylase (PgdA/CDA1 family)
MTTRVALFGNIRSLTGAAFDPNQVEAYLESNTPAGGPLIDTAGKTLQLGATRLDVQPDGSFVQLDVITTNSPDVQPSSGRQYRVRVAYPDPTGARGRSSVDSGWFFLLEESDLADRVVVDYLPTAYTTQAIAQVRAAAAGQVALAAGHAASASGSADEAQAVYDALVVNDLGTSDGQLTAIDGNPTSQFRQQADERLAARIAGSDVVPATLPPHKLAASDEPGFTVCWTYDDGYSSAEPYFALMDARDITGTLFLTKNWVDLGGTNPTWTDTYITQAQVQTIAGNGHEIGTHGLNHESVPGFRDANGDAALAALYDELVDYIEETYTGPGGDPVRVISGAYCAGLSDRRSREIMGRRHQFFRGTKGVVPVDAWDPYDVPSVDVQTLSAAAIKAHIDTAKANGSLCVFLVHGRGPGSTRDAELAAIAEAMDYAASLDARQIPFGQAMTERTARRSPAALDDTSGNSFRRRIRTNRVTIQRGDVLADSAWFAMDVNNNAAYYDSDSGQPFEFRRPVRLIGGAVEVGQRSIYDDGATTNGSTTLTSGAAGFDFYDIGRTVSGAGIPGGTTIVARVSATTVTMSAPATATASGVTITIGRPASDPLNINGETKAYGPLIVLGSAPLLRLANRAGTDLAFYSTTTFGRYGDGGSMTWDTGTGGSNATVKAFRLVHMDHTGVRGISIARTQPSDASIQNGELVLYVDPATGTLRYRGKDDAGVVFQKTVTAS